MSKWFCVSISEEYMLLPGSNAVMVAENQVRLGDVTWSAGHTLSVIEPGCWWETGFKSMIGG